MLVCISSTWHCSGFSSTSFTHLSQSLCFIHRSQPWSGCTGSACQWTQTPSLLDWGPLQGKELKCFCGMNGVNVSCDSISFRLQNVYLKRWFQAGASWTRAEQKHRKSNTTSTRPTASQCFTNVNSSSSHNPLPWVGSRTHFIHEKTGTRKSSGWPQLTDNLPYKSMVMVLELLKGIAHDERDHHPSVS